MHLDIGKSRPIKHSILNDHLTYLACFTNRSIATTLVDERVA
jgi:hypothetical protein